jgi:cytochrome c-type biogenesis protein CcmF
MIMADAGRVLIFLALAWAVWIAVSAIVAESTHDFRWRESARGGALGLALMLTGAMMALEYALVTQNYSIEAVFYHTNTTLPMLFRVGAVWSGDSGSILFWAWILSLYTAFVAWRDAEHYPRLGNIALAVLGGLLTFFLLVDNFITNPFRIIPGHPTNGSGLDPLLQNLVMVMHPPAMYTGLIGMAVPFAYVVGALWLRQTGTEWITLVRRRMLFAWLLLSVALVLGGMWSYMVLGWGGYWEWDPVENAAFLPWLLSTLFLHMIQIDLRRRHIQWWTVATAMSAFLMTLLGTYITRSGVLQNSVHSFVGSGLGPPFVTFFWVALVATLALMWARREVLLSPALGSDTARAQVLQWFALVVTAMVILILFGTLYPVLSKWLWGTAVVYGPNWYDAVTTPPFLILLVLLGLAPMVRWRDGFGPSRELLAPLAGGLIVATFGIGVEHAAGLAPVLAFFACGFALGSIVQELLKVTMPHSGDAAWQRLPQAVVSRRRQIGVQIAHLAFVLMALGVIGSHTDPAQLAVQVHPGQTVSIRGYDITYAGLDHQTVPGRQIYQARLYVTGSGMNNTLITAGETVFQGTAQPLANVAIESGLMQDLYVVLEGWNQGGQVAQLEVLVNPMVSWIWIGMYIMAAGTILMLSRSEPWRVSESEALWLPEKAVEGS